jgi:hypothetical protein
MRADYQLRHQLYGQQGSLWERQVDATTRRRIRRIVKEAGNASTLTELDQIASAATAAQAVLVEDVFFTFTSGNYAIVGQAQRDYSFRLGELADGTRLHVAYRGGYAETDTDALPTQLARVARDFLRAISAADLPPDRGWYLVPIPRDITPLVIEGRGSAVHLVNGVDFTAHDGYIALSDDPETVLPSGLVRVNSALKRVSAPNSTVLARGRGDTGRYLAEYLRKTQSLSAFRRAAAEYAGLYVTQSADIVLDVRGTPGEMVYNFAAAGPVEIRYPHAPLAKHQHLPPGFVVCGRFDVEVGVSKRFAAVSWGKGLMLDGILPVNGLIWDGQGRIPIDYAQTGAGGKPHLRPHFSGPPAKLERLWEFQRLHELRTNVYLYDALGEPATPATIDFWELLENFYGAQLCVILLGPHTPRINVRMWQFAVSYRPQACNALLGIDLGVALAALEVNAQGIPLLDEFGEDYRYVAGTLDGVDNYFRPDGTSLYLRPGGAGYYLRPALADVDPPPSGHHALLTEGGYSILTEDGYEIVLETFE